MSESKITGNISTIAALKIKLEELRKRRQELDFDEKTDQENDKENNRGFTEGGASTTEKKEEEKDLDAQIENAENAISNLKEKMEGLVADLQGVVANMQKAVIDNEANTNNAEEMENLADQYRALGIDCEVVDGDNGYEISVKNEGEFKGGNLLEMSAEEMAELLDEIEEEYLEEAVNNESEKGEEKPPEKEESSEKEESTQKEGGEKSKVKPMGLMPGDVEKEDGDSKEAPKKKSKKDDSKDEKKSKLEEVKPGEAFDHGLGSSSFSDGLGKGKNR